MTELRPFDQDRLLNIQNVLIAKETYSTSPVGELAIKEPAVIGTPANLRDIKVAWETKLFAHPVQNRARIRTSGSIGGPGRSHTCATVHAGADDAPVRKPGGSE